MTWYAFWDAADAFVETDAWYTMKGWLIVFGVLILWGYWHSGKPGGT